MFNRDSKRDKYIVKAISGIVAYAICSTPLMFPAENTFLGIYIVGLLTIFNLIFKTSDKIIWRISDKCKKN